MLNRSLRQRAGRWLVVAALLGAGFAAVAQSEPTLNQIYEAAQAGRMEQAQVMIQQVLVAHPKSAKAHFVQAELLARQGQTARAREALAEAVRQQRSLRRPAICLEPATQSLLGLWPQGNLPLFASFPHQLNVPLRNRNFAHLECQYFGDASAGVIE